MNWVDFIMGALSDIITFAFLATEDGDKANINMGDEEADSSIGVEDFNGRYVTFSCQSCRKLKKHKEVQLNLFQCAKCKRHVDIRAS